MHRIIGLDLLRVISILYIVGVWHLLGYAEPVPLYNNVYTYRLTWILLGTFTLISGYFVGGYDIKRYGVLSFYKKKLFRLYPLYFLAIVLFAAAGIADLNTLIKAALGYSMFIRPAPPTLWFVTMLLVFYFFSPLFISVLKRNFWLYCGLYGMIMGILAGYELISKLYFNYYYLDVRLVVYLAPFMLGLYLAHHKNVSKLVKVLALCSLVLALLLDSGEWGYNLLLSIPMVALCPLVLFDIFRKIKIKSDLCQSVVLFVSYASFCMYLFHRPVYLLLKKVYFPSDLPYQILYLIVVGVTLVIVISYIIQKGYDNVFRYISQFGASRRGGES